MKICTKCKESLPIESFNERSPGYLYRQCKSCRLKARNERFALYPDTKIKAQERSKKWYENNRDKVREKNKANKKYRANRDRWYRIKNTYNLTEQQYWDILNKQNGYCAICEKKVEKLYIDHDHSCCPTETSCGKCVRGILCQKCNMFMHYVDEYLQHLDKAKIYSRKIYEQPF
jgi:hypothetical protein